MNPKVLKIAGYTATAVGMIASIVGAAVSEKQRDMKIAEEVAKAMNNFNK